MPIEVDEARRLDEIAAATIEVARERGVRSVTIRAVAERLGGSTAMITNYLSNRSDLMLNALRRAEGDWTRDLEGELDGVPAEERLGAAARWMCTTERDDEVLRRLRMEIAAAGPSAGSAIEEDRRATSRRHHEELAALAGEAGAGDPALSADILHLLFRGYWLSTLEDPEVWSAERGTRAALAVIDLLRGGSAQASGGG
ncbi:TetR/AcrR family transcriptional regulator [Nocardiopsis aegyptia]|uniref:AcrR family transcriptional regulator n=1 Tax=Nocardiopsis aegyptia TaxID=220378 RepID=A0A7Z0J8L5_9ACTN|nr:TetR/AcrR family transcriptional regulator [Nocardiopsis aegyptia]NYJ32415.1 AcrR family transcriptional regulator [Nocardiopsis aegyptia]